MRENIFKQYIHFKRHPVIQNFFLKYWRATIRIMHSRSSWHFVDGSASCGSPFVIAPTSLCQNSRSAFRFRKAGDSWYGWYHVKPLRNMSMVRLLPAFQLLGWVKFVCNHLARLVLRCVDCFCLLYWFVRKWLCLMNLEKWIVELNESLNPHYLHNPLFTGRLWNIYTVPKYLSC